MTKKEQKKQIENWLDLLILMDNNKCIHVGGVELNLLEMMGDKKIHIYQPHKIAKLLNAEMSFKAFALEKDRYEGSFIYKDVVFYGLYSEAEKNRVEREQKNEKSNNAD